MLGVQSITYSQVDYLFPSLLQNEIGLFIPKYASEWNRVVHSQVGCSFSSMLQNEIGLFILKSVVHSRVDYSFSCRLFILKPVVHSQADCPFPCRLFILKYASEWNRIVHSQTGCSFSSMLQNEIGLFIPKPVVHSQVCLRMK
jgi:hypothetical protein